MSGSCSNIRFERISGDVIDFQLLTNGIGGMDNKLANSMLQMRGAVRRLRSSGLLNALALTDSGFRGWRADRTAGKEVGLSQILDLGEQVFPFLGLDLLHDFPFALVDVLLDSLLHA